MPKDILGLRESYKLIMEFKVGAFMAPSFSPLLTLEEAKFMFNILSTY